MRTKRLFTVLAVGLGLALTLLAGLDTTQAAPASTGLFVTPTGSGDCNQAAPCDLQTALNQAVDGDTIYVAGGTYTRNSPPVVAVTKSITLYGGWDGAASGPVVRSPIAYSTTLDGEGQWRVVHIVGAISPTLDGFVIANGRASEGAGIGICTGAAPIIRNNVITNNVATGGWGGGIEVESSNPLIEHNRIVSNATPYEGGGVAIAFDSHPTLKNNLIAGNSADTRGAGVRLRDVTAILLNNTIAYNTGMGGDGIYAANAAITLTNNIIVSNTYGLRTDGTLTATIMYNDVWSNTLPNYSGLSDPTGSNGNISQNPLFVKGPDGDYYLSQIAAGQAANSPAVDAGLGSVAALGLDNYTTRTDRRGDQGSVDMGYHYRAFNYQVYLPLVLRNY